jgi:GldM C-terminal domain
MLNTFIIVYFALTGNLPGFSKNIPATMYLNVENKISLHLNGCASEDVNLKISTGSLFKRDDSTYSFIPQLEMEDLKIKMYYRKMLVEVKTVSVKKIPDVIPYFVGEKMGKTKKTDINSLGKLTFEFPAGYPEEMKSVVYSFSIFITDLNGVAVYSGNIRGESLDSQSISMVSKLSKGGRIIINNIIVHNSRSGHQRINNSKEIIIEE